MDPTASEVVERLKNHVMPFCALFREQAEEIYLRQLFVVRHRRSQGLGRRAVEILRSQIWPKTKRLTVEVLVANKRAVRFWRSVGYADYALSLEILPAPSPLTARTAGE